jgi:hypothetical protein
MNSNQKEVIQIESYSNLNSKSETDQRRAKTALREENENEIITLTLKENGERKGWNEEKPTWISFPPSRPPLSEKKTHSAVRRRAGKEVEPSCRRRRDPTRGHGLRRRRGAARRRLALPSGNARAGERAHDDVILLLRSSWPATAAARCG